MFNTPWKLFNNGELDKRFCDMAFDWEKAAKLIKKRKPFVAFAMLEDSWDKSKRKIYQGGFPVYEDGTVHSAKLKPMIIMDNDQPVPCFKMEYETNGMQVWPQKALQILEEEE